MPFSGKSRWITSYYSLSFFILLAFGPGACPAVAQTQPQNSVSDKNVLVLHAFESNVPIFELTDRGLRVALDKGGMGIRNQFLEYLDLARNPGPEHRQHLVELLRLRYAYRKIDLIITLYQEALGFVLNEAIGIFPEVPIVALYVPFGYEPRTDRRIIRQFSPPEIKGTLEIALHLVPEAKRVYVVSGANPMEKSLENMAREDFKEWEGRMKFRYLSDLPLEEILAEVSRAPSDTIVFFIGIAEDVTGKSAQGPRDSSREWPSKYLDQELGSRESQCF